MKHGNRLKLIFTLLGVLLGFVIGCMVTFSIMRTQKRSIENPRIMKFGDITISALIPNDANDTDAEELTLYKNDREFLWTFRNSLDEVHNLNLIDGPDNFILSLDASKEPGKWRIASYGPFEAKGEHYLDINFDGQFDLKALMDKNDNVLSRYIYYDGVWKKVDGLLELRNLERQRKVISGSDIFTFHEDSGWQLDDTSKSEPNQVNDLDN